VALAIDPTNFSTLYAATYGGVFKSTNGGANWTAGNSGLPPSPTKVSALAIDPTNPSTLYAGTYGNGVFKSTNGGESWVPTGPETSGPTVFSGGVVNNASYSPSPAAVAPGSITAILGSGLNDGSSVLGSSFGPDGKLATALGGASAMVNNIPAPLFYSTS